MQGKAAKPSDFNPRLSRQRIADLVEHQLHSQLDILLHEVRLLESQHFDEFGFRHEIQIVIDGRSATIDKKKGLRKRSPFDEAIQISRADL